MLPLREHQQGVGIAEGVVHVGGVFDGVGEASAAFVERYGVENAHAAAGIEQPADGNERGGFAHVVGFGLECESPNGYALACEVAAVVVRQFPEHDGFLIFIDFFHGFEHAHGIAGFFCRADEGLHVFREAGASVAAPRVEEFASDARVASDAFPHHVDIGSNQLAKVGNVVHERYAGGKHGVCSVFDHFRAWDVGENDAKVVEQERPIEAAHEFFGFFGIDTHDNAVGAHEILDCRAFFQKFRI